MKLSGNTLKIIAALAMLCDHVGLLFFPDVDIFRIIGRLAFPIFAYFIAEGTRYTKNKLRYFLTVLITGIFCQLVYYVTDKSLYMCTLITFSISILEIYLLQVLKKSIIERKKRSVFFFAAFILSVWAVWVINTFIEIDYGFFGCMLPVFVSVFQPCSKEEKGNSNLLCCLMLTVGLVLLSVNVGWLQPFSLLGVPLLFCYSGERGKLNMKYFFYVFYPGHLAVLGLIDMLRW